MTKGYANAPPNSTVGFAGVGNCDHQILQETCVQAKRLGQSKAQIGGFEHATEFLVRNADHFIGEFDFLRPASIHTGRLLPGYPKLSDEFLQWSRLYKAMQQKEKK